VFQLVRAERSVRRWLDAHAGHAGVGAAGAGVLFHLADLEAGPGPGAGAEAGGSLVGDVTAALGGSPAGTSGLLTRLAAAGLVSKSPDPQDARAVRIALTSRGRRAAGEARAVLGDLNAHLADGFTPAELQVVARWLAHTADALAADTAGPPRRPSPTLSRR
jgi:DNA-binding MarR family transcriptional regulator